ncbi:MAG: 4-hydroxythreonine-4-phosphate dehydrogenase PdxA [Mariprofundales bacterium]
MSVIKPVLLTVGEPAGIGADCILRAYAANPQDFSDVVIVAPIHWLQRRAREIGLRLRIKEYSKVMAASVAHSDILRCWNPMLEDPELSKIQKIKVIAGEPSEKTAKSVLHCITEATKSCLRKESAALVTGPIEKSTLRNTGMRFPGHTELLAHLAGDVPVIMMLASDKLRIALLTTHLALRDVSANLTVESVLQALEITHHSMTERFGIRSPAIALCGLNPHAGERGHFGREDLDILQPAVRQAQQKGLDVQGPLPADSLFSPRQRRLYDVILCCYHDQGLIPIKALSFGESVNVTLGLPFIRTSVDHGTALDRVGSGMVSFDSLLAALHMARRMTGRMAAGS